MRQNGVRPGRTRFAKGGRAKAAGGGVMRRDMMHFPNAGVSVGVDYQASPYERSQVAPYLKGIKRSPIDRSGPSPWDNWSGDNWAAKKGGRAGHRSGGSVKGVGKAKRGFGRALKKGK